MTASAAPLPTRADYLHLLRRYLRPLRGRVFVLSLLLLASIALQLVIPQIMADFIDSVQAAQPLEQLVRLALAYLGVAFVQQLAAAFSTYAAEFVGWSATNALRDDLARHCLHLDLSFHNAHTPGEMIERIDGDVTSISEFFSRFIIQILGNGLLAVGILVVLFRVDWRVGLVMSLFFVAALLVMLRFGSLAVPHYANEDQARAELFGFLEERLNGIEDIRANGGVSDVMNKFYLRMRQLFQKALRAGLSVNLFLNIMFISFAAGNALAFAMGAFLYENQLVTLGVVYLIFQYTTLLERPVEELAHQVGEFQKAGAGIQRVQQLFTEKSSLPEAAFSSDEADALQDGCPALGLVFEQVSFAYHDQPAGEPVPTPADLAGEPLALIDPEVLSPPADEPVVLDRVSFHLEAGQTLGLLGRTGSGKTTLTRLMFRFYDPDSGRLRFDCTDLPLPSNDLSQIPLKTLRRMVGVIPQNVQLFNASLRDNLTFFNPHIPDARLYESIEALGLGEWFAALPAGLDTQLEQGGGMSSGQAQLLAFTRIFLKDPGLVILDEASSRLDPATERLIEQAIDRLVQNRTAVIVAHRLRTVQRADLILILEAGRVLEFGPRLALASDPGSHFHRLLQTGLEEQLA